MREENTKWLAVALVAVFILFMTGMMCFGLVRDKQESHFNATNAFYGVHCENATGVAWIIKNDDREDLIFRHYAVFCDGTGFSGKQSETGEKIRLDKDAVYQFLSGNKPQK